LAAPLGRLGRVRFVPLAQLPFDRRNLLRFPAKHLALQHLELRVHRGHDLSLLLALRFQSPESFFQVDDSFTVGLCQCRSLRQPGILSGLAGNLVLKLRSACNKVLALLLPRFRAGVVLAAHGHL